MSENILIAETAKQRTEAMYLAYMGMIRAFLVEGILVIGKPTHQQETWAKRAALGNDELANTFAHLAQITERAYKQRYLEGMPMVVGIGERVTEPFVDLGPVERFHFLRRIARDQKALEGVAPEPKMHTTPKVLYMKPVDEELPENDPHLPAKQYIECIGEACVGYKGKACNAYEEWMSAEGPTEGRDTSKPPLREEAVSITYGQHCGNKDYPLVSTRTDVLKPKRANTMEIIARSGMHGVPSSVRVVNSG
ncbi:hypothetical protein KA531_03465 [Candidatus Saccharibacteria bacterium]|nr:hypothetical protein [Candidatus Saccharibacteria bacterium]